MKVRYSCPQVTLSIVGVDFSADLIVLESGIIDVILGMRWLAAFDAKIQCKTRSVLLTSPEGEQLEFVATLPSTANCAVNQVQKTFLEDIKVVCDFPDVFPDELPGMPPDRDVEFVIDLLPGTAPISQRPYRMSSKQLHELKTQIKELLDKGFIRPTSSPWGAPVIFVKKKDGT